MKTSPEKQRLFLKGLQHYTYKDKRPNSIALLNASSLTPELLIPFLHPDLVSLNLSRSGLTSIPSEIEQCSLKKLYLSGSFRLTSFDKKEPGLIGARGPLKLPELEVLHIARCEKLTSIQIEALVLSDFKVNQNDKLKMQFNNEGIFGKQAWETYFGDVGKVPPLPHNIVEILNAPCPFWPGKQVKETHLLTLIPRTVNGKLLTLQLLGELMKAIKKGSAIKYSYCDLGQSEDNGTLESHWALMGRDVLPGTRNKTYWEQLKILSNPESGIKQPVMEHLFA